MQSQRITPAHVPHPPVTGASVSVIILTFNEEKHILRCLNSLRPFTQRVFIVDSFSTDRTLEIAREWGAVVVQNAWVNYATQFNFGIANNPFNTTWVMRMDADEYVLPELAEEINRRLSGLPTAVGGVYVKRRVIFLNRWMRNGSYYPAWLLRIWRHGTGFCEQVWHDEHIKLTTGEPIRFDHDLVDHNLNNLTWWTQKHNHYTILEAINLLNYQYKFDEGETVQARFFGTQEQRMRFLKEMYASLPLFTRPILYFMYRYFMRLGFLDGRAGFVWSFLQALWYRFLVDAKLLEIRIRVGRDRAAIIDYFRTEYGKDLTAIRPETSASPEPAQPGRTDLSRYDNGWYKPGPRWKQLLWFLANSLFLHTYIPTPVALKVWVLRLFGARLGTGVMIKPGVNIKYPWLLTVGNHVWIGEQVWIDNLIDVVIDNNVCLSQGAMLLTGNHDYRRPTFDLVTQSIRLDDGVWIGAKAVVCPGVHCQSHAVLAVSSVATRSLEPYGIYQGNPAVWVRQRTIREAADRL